MAVETTPILGTETLKEKPDQMRYAVASAVHLGLATPYFLTMDVGDHVAFAQNEAGLDGVELWNSRLRVRNQIRNANLDPQTVRGVLSAHQNPFAEKHPSRMKTIARNAQLQAVLPEGNKSMPDLESLARRLGGLNVVVFRQVDQRYLNSPHFVDTMLQPDPESWHYWQVSSNQEYAEKALGELGVKSLCPDTNHLRRRDTHTLAPPPFGDWREALATFLPHAHEIHLAAGRTDEFAAGGKEKSIRELAALMRGRDFPDTESVAMVDYIARSGWRGQITLEIMPPAVNMVNEKKSLFVARRNVANALEMIAENTLRPKFDDRY